MHWIFTTWRLLEDTESFSFIAETRKKKPCRLEPLEGLQIIFGQKVTNYYRWTLSLASTLLLKETSTLYLYESIRHRFVFLVGKRTNCFHFLTVKEKPWINWFQNGPQWGLNFEIESDCSRDGSPMGIPQSRKHSPELISTSSLSTWSTRPSLWSRRSA